MRFFVDRTSYGQAFAMEPYIFYREISMPKNSGHFPFWYDKDVERTEAFHRKNWICEIPCTKKWIRFHFGKLRITKNRNHLGGLL